LVSSNSFLFHLFHNIVHVVDEHGTGLRDEDDVGEDELKYENGAEETRENEEKQKRKEEQKTRKEQQKVEALQGSRRSKRNEEAKKRKEEEKLAAKQKKAAHVSKPQPTDSNQVSLRTQQTHNTHTHTF
jgi:ATPase subunit of ABC transporter with duplicated ATPase domains